MSESRGSLYVVLLGPPGAGKGTQAVEAAKRTGLLHLSTGDMFREHLRGGTELGQLAKGYMDQGELVPDEVTIRMLLERIDREDARAGCLFDGFPRTVEQARALDGALEGRGDRVSVAALIDVSDAEIVRRLGGRVSCASCGMVFHREFNPPSEGSPCCGEVDLVQRDDDQPQAIANRLQVYGEQTAPLVEFYEAAGKLSRVDGARPPSEVGEELLAVLEASRVGSAGGSG